MLLMAKAPRDEQPAFFQPRKLTLRRPGAGARIPDQLR